MLVGVVGFVCFGIACFAGLVHVSRLVYLQEALRAHRLWWRPAIPIVAVAVAGIEISLGVAGLLSIVLGDVTATRVLLAVTGGLFGAYAGYGVVVMKLRGEVPCGCSVRAGSFDLATLLRAGALVTGALAAASGVVKPPLANMSSLELAFTLLASCGLGVILWSLPDALTSPAESTSRAHNADVNSFQRTAPASSGESSTVR